jgi:hypothetical protein
MQSDFFAKIPNNEEGRYFLYLLDKYLNKKSYLIKKRGRIPNHELIDKEIAEGKLHKETRFWQCVPEKYALAFNLYICVRRENMCPGVIGISTFKSEQRRWEEAIEFQGRINDLTERIETLEFLKLERDLMRDVGTTDLEPRYQHLGNKDGGIE